MLVAVTGQYAHIGVIAGDFILNQELVIVAGALQVVQHFAQIRLVVKAENLLFALEFGIVIHRGVCRLGNHRIIKVKF